MPLAIDGAVVGMDRTSDADLFFFESLLLIFFLKLPNFIDVTSSCSNLALFFDERVLAFELLSFSEISILRNVQPCVVDLLSLFPKLLDSIDVCIIVRLML